MNKKSPKPDEPKEVAVAKLVLIGTIVTAVFAFAGAIISALIQRPPTPTPQPLPTVQNTYVLQPSVTSPSPTEQPFKHIPSLGSFCDGNGCNGDPQTRLGDGTVMVYVPTGEFEMGSAEGYGNERPIHIVALDGFWIDRTEVANAQYRRCVDAGACNPPARSLSASRDPYYYDSSVYGDYPVIWVSWYDAEDYCAWVGTRLPTEAEWEYAARGSDGHIYPWGNSEPDCDKSNHWGGEGGCVGDTSAVESHPDGASWCGALDMAGNVWEWVADWYGSYPAERQINPVGPSAGEHRVLRGGSCFYDPNYPPFDVRSTYRGQYGPTDSSYTIGFRCAKGSE